jgi:hypothetical protein
MLSRTFRELNFIVRQNSCVSHGVDQPLIVNVIAANLQHASRRDSGLGSGLQFSVFRDAIIAFAMTPAAED